MRVPLKLLYYINLNFDSLSLFFYCCCIKCTKKIILSIFVSSLVIKKKKKNKTNKIFKTIRYPTYSKIIYCLYTGEKEWYEKVVGQRSSPSDITFNNVKTALLISKGLILSVVVWRNQRSRHIVASFKVDVCINGRSAHLHTASQAAIHTGQTDRSRSDGWKPMSKIRWPIYQMHNASSGHKGHTGRYPSASRLSISIQNQYGVSRWCVNTKGPEAIPLPPGHPYNCFLYRSQLNAAKTDRFSHRFHAFENCGPSEDGPAATG